MIAVPYADFKDCALVLTDEQLQQQCLRAKQLLMFLEQKIELAGADVVDTIWQGHEKILALFGFCMCADAKRRHLKLGFDRSYFATRLPKHNFNAPEWLGDEEFHSGQKLALVKLMPERYGQLWPDLLESDEDDSRDE